MPRNPGLRPAAEYQMLNVNQTLNHILGPRRLPKPRKASEEPHAPLQKQVSEGTTAVQERDGTQQMHGQPTAEGPLSDPGQPLSSPLGQATLQPAETAAAMTPGSPRQTTLSANQGPVGQQPQFTRNAPGSLLQTPQPPNPAAGPRPQPSRTPSLPYPPSTLGSAEAALSASAFAFRPDPATKSPGSVPGFSSHSNRSATHPYPVTQEEGFSQPASVLSRVPSAPSTPRGISVADHAPRTTVTVPLPSPTPTDEPSPAALGYIGSPQSASIRMEAQAAQTGANMGASGTSTPQTQSETILVQHASNALASSAQPNATGSTTPGTPGLTGNNVPCDGAMPPQQPLPLVEGDDPFDLEAMARVLKEKRDSFDEAAMQHAVTRPRMVFLENAVQAGDLFYVLLHQLFCAWSASKELVHPLLSISADQVDVAFDILQYALRPNNQMPEEHLGWFASFPTNRRSTIIANEPGKSLREQISAFLLRMSQQWQAFILSLASRGYPILVWELESLFCLKSPTLQGILFTVCRRTMGISDGEAGWTMQRLFEKDRSTANANLSLIQKQDFQTKLIMSYSQVVSEYRTAVARQQQQLQQQQIQQQHQQHQHHRQHQHPHHQSQHHQQIPQQDLQMYQQQQQQMQQQRPQQMQMMQQPQFQPQQQQPMQGPLQAPQLQSHMPLQHQTQGLAHPATYLPSRRPQQIQPGGSTRGPQMQHGSFHSAPTHYMPTQRQPQSHITPYPPMQGVAMPPQNIQPILSPQQMAGNFQRPNSRGGVVAYRQAQHSPALPSPGTQRSPMSLPLPTPPMQDVSPLGIIQQPGASQNVARGFNSPQVGSGVVPNAQPRATVTPHDQVSQQQGSPLVAGSGPGFQGRNGISEGVNVVNSLHQGLVPSLGARQETNPAHTQPGSAAQLPRPSLNTAINPASFSFHNSASPTTASPTPMAGRVMPRHVSPAQLTAGGRAPGALMPAPNHAITIDRFPQSPFDPRSAEMSLHQIHARSPRRVPVPLPGSPNPTEGKYHQAVRTVLVGPSSMGSGSRNVGLDFDVSAEVLARLSKSVYPMGAYQAAAGYFEGALRYRFRMCAIPISDAKSVSEESWVMTTTSWPEHVFVTFNETAMPIRRKTHNGAALPVELTPLLRLGKNTLHVSVLQTAKPKQNVVYFAAVELVETRGTDTIRRHVIEHNTIPASVTSNLVAERLKSAEAGDELVIMDNTVSIDLSDPFTMRMFKVPVRGATCTHLECFDLDTWLDTRTGKPLCHHRGRQMCESCRSFESLGPEPTYTDQWKCPICSSDARPRSLRVDSYLCRVRDQLIAQGKAAAKSILVHPDGSWTAKIEEDVDSDEDEGPSAKRRKSDAPGKDRGPGPAIEVIELD